MAGMTQKKHSITTSQLYFHCGPSVKGEEEEELKNLMKKKKSFKIAEGPYF